MKAPSVIASVVFSALAVAAIAGLGYLSGHLGELGVPAMYTALANVIITTLIRMLQEWQPDAATATRGMDGPQPNYLQRVLYAERGWSWSG